MKRNNVLTYFVFLALFSLSLLFSCHKKESTPEAKPLLFETPSNFPPAVYDFSNNQLTEEGFQLGKKLFYEGRLSKDGNFACASCHQQFAAFANFDHALSHGFNNQFTTRNAPPLFNLAWQKNFHWDGGINHLENQPLAPITAPNEMAEDITNVLEKLRKDTLYPKMFTKAFGDPLINSQRMLKALSQFMVSLVSADSRFDRMKKGQLAFTEAEKNGYQIFQVKCAGCHPEPFFTDYSFRNTGLPLDPFLRDQGRMRITGKSEDSLKFKVPSLRNVALSFPYGHDGRFYALANVLDHYSTGVVVGPTTDSLVRNKIPLSEVEKFYIKQFLNTLTDTVFIKNKRFAE